MGFWIAVALAAAFSFAVYLYRRWAAAQLGASYPTTWFQSGTPVADAALALLVIAERCPGKVRQGGYIEWLDELPFTCGTLPAAGCAVSLKIPKLQVSRIEPVEKSALAHEVGHYYWYELYGKTGTGDPAFEEWLRLTNLEIARRAGRA